MSGTEVELQFDIQTFNYGKAIDVILYLCWCNVNSAGEQTCSLFDIPTVLKIKDMRTTCPAPGGDCTVMILSLF